MIRRYRKWGTPRGVGRPGLNHLWVKYDGLPWFRTCDGVARRDVTEIRAPKHQWPKAWCASCLNAIPWTPQQRDAPRGGGGALLAARRSSP